MTGVVEKSKRCPLCGGFLTAGDATIPYILKDNTVIVVKHVPAEICGDCGEALTTSAVTARIVTMLKDLKRLHSEVSVVSYAQVEPAAPSGYP